MSLAYSPILFEDAEKVIAVLLGAKSEWLESTLKNIVTGLGHNMTDRINTIFKSRRKLKSLRNLPVIEQRSEEWYRIRQELLTASDLAQALDKGKFGNRNDLLAKKANIGQTGGFNSTIPALKWGIMYEPVAQKCYQKMHDNIHIYEFGLIQHPKFPIFGASPDGITSLGTMLEIKCPHKRKIIPGEVMEQYFLQIQGQLEVCDLEECDYFECVFKEYSRDEALAMATEGGKNRYVGVIYECYTAPDAGPLDAYIYSDCYLSGNDEEMNAFIKWDEENSAKYVDSIRWKNYWVLQDTNLVRVKRDKNLFATLKPDIEKFWAEVQEARITGVIPNMKPKVVKPRVVKPKAKDVFAFVDDELTN